MGVVRSIICASAGWPRQPAPGVASFIDIAGGGVTPRFGALPYRQGEPAQVWASTARTQEVLGFVPCTPLSRGLSTEWQEMKTTLRSSR